MLALVLAICITGIFTQGSEERQGAITGVLSIGAGTWLKEVHETLAIAMLLVVGGHLAGVAVGSWLHKENLPLTMIDGMKQVPDETPLSANSRGVGVAILVAVASFGAWWFFYAWHEPVKARLGQTDVTSQTPHVAFVGLSLADDPTWREECGSCHLAFHPNLLPSRSWQRIIEEQGKHFGTDLSLDATTSAAILTFLVRNAAEFSPTEAAFKINRSIPAGETPVRITTAPYWVEKHSEIGESEWQSPLVKSKANCAACHLDAAAGTFEDAAMRNPRKIQAEGTTPRVP
jgi:hypothetical protein